MVRFLDFAPQATLLGEGDLSDKNYSQYTKEVDFNEFLYENPQVMAETPFHCSAKLLVSPTRLYMEDNESHLPLILAIVVGVIFGIMGVLFVVYDVHAQKRNHKMVHTAARTGAIVSSLFPSTFRDRLDHALLDHRRDSNNSNTKGKKDKAMTLTNTTTTATDQEQWRRYE